MHDIMLAQPEVERLRAKFRVKMVLPTVSIYLVFLVIGEVPFHHHNHCRRRRHHHHAKNKLMTHTQRFTHLTMVCLRVCCVQVCLGVCVCVFVWM